MITSDIQNKEGYLITNNEGIIMATLMFTTQPEGSYLHIDGQWISKPDATYGVIHRLAVDDNFRKMGISRFVFLYFENWLKTQGIESLRVDTHIENTAMQGLLKSLNYTYCGIIILDCGSKRLAFEKRV